MTWPPPRTNVETWTAVTGPKRCITCGHDHYGWQSSNLALAPQWTWCDQPGCYCRSLRPR